MGFPRKASVGLSATIFFAQSSKKRFPLLSLTRIQTANTKNIAFEQWVLKRKIIPVVL